MAAGVDLSQFGSFGAGAQQAVSNALARRKQGEGVPALQQQGQTSPTAAVPPPQPTTGVSSPQSAVGGVPGAGGDVGNPEARLIITGLNGRLKAISDVEKGMLGLG